MAGAKRKAFLKEYGADNAIVFAQNDIQGSIEVTDIKVRVQKPFELENIPKKMNTNLQKLKKMKLKESHDNIIEESESEEDIEMEFDENPTKKLTINENDPFLSSFVRPDLSKRNLQPIKLRKSGCIIDGNLSNFSLSATPNIDNLFGTLRYPADIAGEKLAFLWNCLEQHCDVLYSIRKWSESEKIRQLVSLHCANHILKTISLRRQNNAKIEEDPQLEIRDQGYGRGSILYVCPMKNSAKDFVDSLLLNLDFYKIHGYDRLTKLYGVGDEHDEDEYVYDDFEATFRDNTDDNFAMGVKFTKSGIKLLCTLSKADVIIASPLALKENKEIAMLLSSIEIAIFDQTSDLKMQNWSNVDFIFSKMNLIPSTTSASTDIMRIKNHLLDSQGAKVRQTVFISDYLFPELSNCFRSLVNIKGSTRFRPICNSQLPKGIKQVFTPIHCSTVQSADDSRFYFFQKQLANAIKDGTILVVPQYHDYMRLKLYLDEENKDFEELSEYTDIKDVNRARTLFFKGEIRFLLYSERLWYYKRSPIKNAKHILFYSPPETVNGYKNISKWVQSGTVQILYTKFDFLALERILGSNKSKQMVKEMSTALFK
eukprot:NODE_39_length_35218_cov_0.479655.p1 type:complete len:598 gc:universal NODE_39_length_35218_cov_0.479655:25176-26969(+)